MLEQSVIGDDEIRPKHGCRDDALVVPHQPGLEPLWCRDRRHIGRRRCPYPDRPRACDYLRNCAKKIVVAAGLPVPFAAIAPEQGVGLFLWRRCRHLPDSSPDVWSRSAMHLGAQSLMLVPSCAVLNCFLRGLLAPPMLSHRVDVPASPPGSKGSTTSDKSSQERR